MKNYYFDRVGGNIAGVCRNSQYPGQESLPETDQEIIDWFAAQDQKQTGKEAEQAQIAQDTEKIMPDLSTFLEKADAVQNVPDIREFLKEQARIIYYLATNKIS